MKYTIAAIALTACIAGGALAQTTPPAAPAADAPVPASSCPAYPAMIALPDPASLKNTKALNAGTEKVNAWLNAYQTVHSCRIDEVNRLRPAAMQFDARAKEAREAQTAVLAKRQEWENVVNASMEAQKKKK